MVRQKMLDIVISQMSRLFANVEDMLKMGRPPDPLYVASTNPSAKYNAAAAADTYASSGSSSSGDRRPNSLRSLVRGAAAGGGGGGDGGSHDGLFGILNLLVEESSRLRPLGSSLGQGGSRGQLNTLYLFCPSRNSST